MMSEKWHYVTEHTCIKDCFIGKVGDKIRIDWNHYDGELVENLTSNTNFCPISTNEIACLDEGVKVEL